MWTTRRTALLGGALATILGTAVLAAPPAVAEPLPPVGVTELPPATDPAPPGSTDEAPTTVSAIVVVDGEAEVITREAAPSEVAEVTEELERQPGVVDVSVDTPASIAAEDPYRYAQWALDDLRLPELPAGAADGSGQLVAVLDTGVLATHEDLAGRVRCDLGADFAPDAGSYPGTNGCIDPHGHGTHVAGQISAVSDNGLGITGASNAEIMPVRVLGTSGSGTSATIASGIIWAVDHGADVINMSLSGPYNSQYNTAVKYATDRDVVVVAAAGNNRAEGNTVNYPAASPGAIAVAATDDLRQSTYFSYSGPTNWISAGGWSVVSTDPLYEYVSRSGTSMAAPHVAAVLARHRDAFPTHTQAQIRDLVRTTAIDIETPGFDDNTGHGLIDAYELITGAEGPVVSAPGAPTGVTATRGDRQATVSWAAAPDGGSPVTGYLVTASPGGATATTTGGTSATVTGLANGTAYTFTVTATNAVGTGPASAASAAVTPAGVPTAPTGVTAVRGDGSATVSWTAATANGTPVAGYRVTATPGGPTATVTGTTTTAAVTGLTNGTSYTFRVTATNAVGTSGASAASNAVVPAGPPAAPTGLTVRPGDRSVVVTWVAASGNGSPVTGYTVTASAGGAPVATATTSGALTATVTGLSNGTTYTITVRATNALGTGPAGPGLDTVPTVPVAAPAAPTSVTATAGDRRATVSWTPGADNGSPVFEYTVTASPGGITTVVVGTTATVTGLTNGTAYSFRVVARNSMGTSPASAPSAAVTPRAPSPITVAYQQAGGDTGPLGPPTSAERCGLRNGGCFQKFAHGSVYWSPATGARVVMAGPVMTRWGAQRWETGALGYPVSDTVCGLAGGGCRQDFQGGSVSASAAGGYVVLGAIRTRWTAGGREGGALGHPITEERCGLRNGGCFQKFAHGSVYWSPATGARVVMAGPVMTRWGAQRWETGALGYPVSDTVCGLAGGGCYQHFQGGSVYSGSAGAFVVRGALRTRWSATGWERGALGYPVAEERCGLRDGGCFQRYQGGSIYWSPAGGAWSVGTQVLAAWGAQSYERGRYGYPAGEAVCTPAGACTQRFQGGTASWSASTPVRFR
ncbi:fibronectin type III domain-containing protein [Blastococcus sp. SYSU D00813]